MKLRFVFPIALILVSLNAFGQVTAPYVSRLEAKSDVKSVLLTWKDAEGFDGGVYEVWRSSVEINKESLSSGTLLGTVKAGVQQFEDKTLTGPSYYIVLLRDKNGARQDFFIPFRNKTAQPVGLVTTNDNIAAGLKDLTAEALGKQIFLRFTATPPERKLMIFRSSKPVSSLTDLKDATLLGQITGSQAPFKDAPPPGLEFYYTVLDALAFSDGASDVFTPANTTSKPIGLPLVELPTDLKKAEVDLKLRPETDRGPRPLPLPALNVEKDPVSGTNLPPAALIPKPPQPLSADTQKALTLFAKSPDVVAKPLPSPVILPEEKTSDPQGSEKLLTRIITTYFAGKEWEQSRDQLRVFLKLELDAKVAARARFYLGQTLAFLKDYRSAFLELDLARESYRIETQDLLESLFSFLRAQSQTAISTKD